jgi:hypothetical protein
MGYGTVSELENVWKGIKGRSDILTFNTFSFLWKPGIYNMGPLKKLIDNFTSNKPKLARVTVCRVCLLNGRVD